MRFLISGYYGFGNLGDEALLAIIAAQLKTRYPLATVDALSSDPARRRTHELRIEATPRWDQGAIREAIGRADVVLSGGGGLLQNATSLKSLLYYAGIVRTAIRANKKTMVFGQSIGPLDFWGKQTVRECCRGLSAATARDARSRELLASLVSVDVARTADPVLLYEAPEREVDIARSGLGPGSEPLVVVCARKTSHGNDAVAVLAATIDRLALRHGARVALVPFDGVPDADFATTVIKKCESAPSLVQLAGLDEVAAAIASARLVVGVRFHALVLALRFGVPFLHVAYDPKISGFVDDLRYPLEALWAPGQRPNHGRIEQLVDRAWAERDDLAATLRTAYAEQRTLARQNFDVLDRVVRA